MSLLLYLATTAALLTLWSRRVQRLSLVAALVLILLPTVFTGKALLMDRVYTTTDILFRDPPFRDYGKDFGVEHLHNGFVVDPFAQLAPWQRAVRHAIANGEWPLWNPFVLSGTVLAGAMMSAPYDPLNLVGLLLPVDLGITFFAATSLFLAGWFAFAFARELGADEGPSLVAAGVYAFCTSIAFTAVWPHARTWGLLGLILLAVRRVVSAPDRRNGLLLAIALALAVLAGHPESLLHVVGCGIAYGIFELFRVRRGAFRAVGVAIAAGLIALLLTAVSLLPFVEAMLQTVEYAMRSHEAEVVFESDPARIASRAGATFIPFHGGVAWRNNLTWHWEGMTARAGSIAFALAVAALFVGRKRIETWFFFGLAVVGLFAYFEAPPVHQLLHAIPLFEIALNDRLSFAAGFALAILGALALHERHPRLTAVAVTLTGIALAIATALVWQREIAAGVNPSIAKLLTTAEFVPLAFVIAALFVPRRIGIAVILIALSVQRYIEDGQIYPSLPRSTFYPRIPVIDALKAPEPFRIVAVGRRFTPNSSTFYGLEDARGYEAMTLSRYRNLYDLWCVPQPTFFNRVDDLSRPMLSLLNVRFAIAPRTLAPPDGWRVVLDDRESRVVENTRVLPRAFAPRLIRFRNNEVEVVDEMKQAADFAETGWISSDTQPRGEIPNARATLTTRRNGTGYAIDATMESGGWIVITESAWKGWRATIDGRPTRVHYANHAFLGLFVPKGRHQVRLTYRPRSFDIGLTVSAVTLLALIVASRRRR